MKMIMIDRQIIPHKELQHLGDLISYFIVQRELYKPVSVLKRCVSDISTQLKSIIIQYYFPLPSIKEVSFLNRFVRYLDNLLGELNEEGIDEEYSNYSIDKIISSFELAANIKKKMRNIEHGIKMINHYPFMEPFDLKLRPYFKVINNDDLYRQDVHAANLRRYD